MTIGATGIVLAGGASRRFGSNKALASWRGGTLIEAAVETATRIFPETLVPAKDTKAYSFLTRPGVRVLPDIIEETHALGGLYSGLSEAKTEWAFATACDMPLARPELVRALWEARGPYHAVVPVWKGRTQPLCAFYSRRILGVLRLMLEEGRLKVRDLFDVVPTRFFLEREAAAADPDGLSFVDIDTPRDYEATRRLRAEAAC